MLSSIFLNDDKHNCKGSPVSPARPARVSCLPEVSCKPMLRGQTGSAKGVSRETESPSMGFQRVTLTAVLKLTLGKV